LPLIAGQSNGYTPVDGDCVEAELPDVIVDVTVCEDGVVVTDPTLSLVTAAAEAEIELVEEEPPVVGVVCDVTVVVD
jgi:hypothetical protein